MGCRENTWTDRSRWSEGFPYASGLPTQEHPRQHPTAWISLGTFSGVSLSSPQLVTDRNGAEISSLLLCLRREILRYVLEHCSLIRERHMMASGVWAVITEKRNVIDIYGSRWRMLLNILQQSGQPRWWNYSAKMPVRPRLRNCHRNGRRRNVLKSQSTWRRLLELSFTSWLCILSSSPTDVCIPRSSRQLTLEPLTWGL